MTNPSSPIHRQWRLIRALSARRLGLTVREMAAEAEVDCKTIRRDLELFRALGFPLEETTGEFGRKTYRMTSISGQPALSFPFDEALALYLSRRLLEPLAGTLFWESAQSAFRKIRAGLDERARRYIERMACLFHPTAVGRSDYSKKADVLDALTQAIEEMHAAHLLYQSDRATEPAFRPVYPYHFIYHRFSIYLVAHDPEENRIKHYKLDRIEQVEPSNFPFRIPPGYDPAAHLLPSFGVYLGDGAVRTIRVRFASSVARYVQESAWHPSEVLTRQRDGSLLAEYQLGSTEEFRSWILGFGRKAVVIEPEELRREIADELRAMAEAYGLGQRRKSWNHEPHE